MNTLTDDLREQIEYLFYNTKENQDENIARQLSISTQHVSDHIYNILLAKRHKMNKYPEVEQPLIYESKMNYEAVYKIKY